MQTKPSVTLPRGALILAAIIWGSTFFIMKELATYFSSAFLMTVRFSIGMIFFFLLSIPHIREIKNRQYLIYATLSGVSLSLGYLLQTVGLSLDTSPGKSAFLTAAYCVFVPFLIWLVHRRTPRALQVAASLLCAAGIGLVSLSERLTMSIGDLLTLLGSIAFAANLVALEDGAKACKHLNVLLLGQFSVATFLCGALSLASSRILVVPSPRIVGTLILVALLASALCMWLQAYGLRHIPSQEASLLLALESVFGAMFSVLFYGEALSARMIFGFIVILGSIVLSQSNLSLSRPKKRTPFSHHN